MFRFIALTALVALSAAQQYKDPKHAAIISEQRYLSNNGQFGAAYTQEDGIDFKEETDEQGNRRGEYSYVDPNGQVRKVSYVAGKNGFQATGDHLPVAPPAPPQPIPQAVQPQYQPNGPAYKDPYDTSDRYDDGSYDERWNNPGFQGDGRQQAAPAQQYRPAPAPAPVQQQYRANPAPAPVQPSYNYQHQPQQPAPVRQQNYNVPQQNYIDNTTPSPNRFFPPGKLSLNRTPDGFSFSFNKA